MPFTNYPVIFHIDGDAFYASVEETLYPELKKVPMAVCGNPNSRRGIILSKNQLANQYGVKTAETIWQARKKCPDLVLAPGRRDLYVEYCEKLNSIYEEYTDQVERLSIDESFLDVTGSLHLFGLGPKELADAIRIRVEKELGLTVSVGVSYNKLFAKMGSDLKKPNGTSVIEPETYKEILWPMAAGQLYSVGKATAERLAGLEIRTIGDIANTDPVFLEEALGKLGRQLYRFANGLDNRPVRKTGDREAIHSVGNGCTFKRNLISWEDITVGVLSLADTVATRLRKKGLKCTTVQLMIKDPDFKVVSRQAAIEPTWLASDITKKSLDILKTYWPKWAPIRMLTITGTNLVPASEATEQLSFFQDSPQKEGGEKREKLEKAMDDIRGRYGKYSLSPASVVKNELGLGKKRERTSEDKENKKN